MLNCIQASPLFPAVICNGLTHGFSYMNLPCASFLFLARRKALTRRSKPPNTTATVKEIANNLPLLMAVFIKASNGNCVCVIILFFGFKGINNYSKYIFYTIDSLVNRFSGSVFKGYGFPFVFFIEFR